MSFAATGLSENVLNAIGEAGYTEPTPIQAQAIPVVLMGRDVLGCAQTGTGKTASFTLPMIDILDNGRARARMPRSLILEPTRELATQVADNFRIYGKTAKLNYALLIGGESFIDQEKALDRGVDVLIATPGRLIDLVERGKVLMADVRMLVIDEADRMLDMGFIPDVERIVSLLPTMRQTLFFSATMPPEIKSLADKFLMNPKEITVSPPSSTALTVFQGLIKVEQKQKRKMLRALLTQEDVNNAIIFCNRKRDIGILQRSLDRHGFKAGALHGDMPQSKRTETLEAFKKGEISLLVASDVAARGIDISDLSHVFNFDIPTHAEDYVHRIGRTGRAGRSGRAFTFCTSTDDKYLQAIEKLIEKPIEPFQPEGYEDIIKDDRREKASARRKTAGREEKTSTRRSRRWSGEEESAASEPSAQPYAPEDYGKEPQRANAVNRNRDRRNRDRRSERYEEDVPVKGLGDHCPAFLLRPIPQSLRKSSSRDKNL